MIRVNLLPASELREAIGRRQQMALGALGVAVSVLIMVVPFAMQGRQLTALDARTEDLRKEVQQLDVQVREVREIDRLKKELRAKLDIIEDLNRKRIGPARALEDLSAATPDNLWLIDFAENKGQATLTGMALDNETIARFMRQLQDSKYFYRIDLVETSRSAPPGAAAPAGPGAEPPAFTRFIIKAGVDYFGRDGKPTDAPAGAVKEPPIGIPVPAAGEPRR